MNPVQPVIQPQHAAVPQAQRAILHWSGALKKREEFPSAERSIETFANVQQLFKKQNRSKAKENRNRKQSDKGYRKPIK